MNEDVHLRTALAAAMLAITIISAGFFLTLGYQVGKFPIIVPEYEITYGDGIPPQWTDYSPRGTQEVGEGEIVTLSADWIDTGTVVLANASLYTNESGKMALTDSMDLEGNESTSSFSYQVANIPDWTVEWYIIAFDLGGESNKTPRGILTTKDMSGPECTLSQESDTPGVGETNVLTAFCTDDSGVKNITLITDESGEFEEVIGKYGSPAEVEGISASVDFNWSNPNITKGSIINWKVKAVDEKGNEKESSILSFTVGGTEISDTEPPELVSPPSFATATPYEGVEVDIEVSFEDNVGLEKIWLEVEGEEVMSKDVSGTSATEVLSWVATGTGEVKWRVYAQDVSGNVYSSEEFTFTVLAAPPEIPCDPAGKPEDKIGPCKEVDGAYEQSVLTYECDTSTGTWKPVVHTQPCEPGLLPPVVAPISLITAALIIVVGVLATYFLVLRKPAAKVTKRLKFK